MNQKNTEQHCGYVALIGAPNAGKSTLLNSLTGSRIAAVTPKPQTTRGRMRGIVNTGNAQIIFVDTPGVFNAKPRFEKAMVAAAWSGVEEADSVLLLVDASKGLDADTRLVLEKINTRKKPAALVLNKVDKVKDKTVLPALAQQMLEQCSFDSVFMISATRGDGVKDIISYLAQRMPAGHWLYSGDEVTDSTERDLATEITREQCFLRLHEELPYGLAVEHETWEEKTVNGKRSIKIRQALVVAREGHKKILLGAGGAMLRSIGASSRQIIGQVLDAEVHLFLFVKVQEGWKEQADMFRKAGLEY
jgi:GTP-binding protein Era